MPSEFLMTNCKLCPRACGVDRTQKTGACGEGAQMRVAKVMLHRYEEPPISGTNGSGAIFFCGCNLRCGYCQNAAISHHVASGERYSAERLAETMLALQQASAHNINLITAAHFVPQVAESLALAKPQLKIPVVYNSSGYEKVSALRLLDDLIDVYLPDFKYLDAAVAARYSAAEDYPTVAKAAIAEMVRQTGDYTEQNGLLVRGTLIRHLVLPGQSRDSERIMQYIAEHFPQARVSIMNQYTPAFNRTGDKTLNRRVTSLEYNRVTAAAAKCNLDGFTQERSSAVDAYTPDFTRHPNEL